MSRIAAIVLLAMLAMHAMPARAAPPVMTAREVAYAAAKATSIGPDPCRNPDGDEIVVCGSRETPYALPGYDPPGRYSDDSVAGGSRMRMTKDIRQAGGACATGNAFCMPAPAVNMFQVLPVLVKGIKRLIEGDD